jgi:HlyD family secretion protein
LIYAEDGALVPSPKRPKRSIGFFGGTASTADTTPPPVVLLPGQTRKETEGVFLVQNGQAAFRPVRIGIAGERYFEVLSGLSPGDRVITGPYNTVRGMADGDAVTIAAGSSMAAGGQAD